MARKESPAPGGSAAIKAAKAAEKALPKREKHDINLPWWRLEGSDSAQVANAAIQQWLAFDTPRQNDLVLFARLYGSGQLQFAGSIQSRNIQTGARNRIQDPNAATFNGIQSCVSTITNTVAQHKPVVQFAATDGDWMSHKIARERARFIAGWFYEQEVYKKTAIQFRDSGVWADGIVGVFNRNGRAICERVFPGDIFVDPASCITNNAPREMGRIHLMDRHTAWAMFDGDPEAQAKIEDAPPVHMTVDQSSTDQSDLIQINEMWRLPSFEGAGDGKHLLATQLDVLELKEWKHPNFPFAIIQCEPRLFGFWSQGWAELLENLQLQYDDTEYFINEAIELCAGASLFVDSSSNVVVDSLDNAPGRVMRGDGKPTSLLFQIIQPEIYEKQRERKRQFYEQTGISQMVASQEKADPNESGIAIRERVGIYDERHALWTQSYQDAHLTLARLAIQTAGDILDEEKAAEAKERERAKAAGEKYEGADACYYVYSVNSPQSDPIDFGELRFQPDEQYVLSSMPVAQLPDTIEGRIALAQDFVQNGYYDEATARSVFLAPFDTTRVETLYNAAHDFFSKTLDAIVEKGTQPPEPQTIDNLALGFKMALQYYAYAKVRDVAIDKIDTLSKYVVALHAKMMEAKASGMADAMAEASGQPLGNPAAAPTSQLLPTPNAAQPQ